MSSSNNGPPAKRARRNNPEYSSSSTVENDIPSSAHYQISYAHRAVVTCACFSTKHDIVLTASQDGIVKFWKRTSATSSSITPNKKSDLFSGRSGGGGKEADDATSLTGTCMEFIKSYIAHTAPLLALVNTLPDGDNAASVGEDNVIKFYDVANFDVTGMIQVKDRYKLGGSVAFVGEDQSLLAVSSKNNSGDKDGHGNNNYNNNNGADSFCKPGTIFIFSSITLAPTPVKEITLHAAPLTALAYNYKHHCMISADEVRLLFFFFQFRCRGQRAFISLVLFTMYTYMCCASKL